MVMESREIQPTCEKIDVLPLRTLILRAGTKIRNKHTNEEKTIERFEVVHVTTDGARLNTYDLGRNWTLVDE